jgi:hypothetical protein
MIVMFNSTAALTNRAFRVWSDDDATLQATHVHFRQRSLPEVLSIRTSASTATG